MALQPLQNEVPQSLQGPFDGALVWLIERLQQQPQLEALGLGQRPPRRRGRCQERSVLQVPKAPGRVPRGLGEAVGAAVPHFQEVHKPPPLGRPLWPHSLGGRGALARGCRGLCDTSSGVIRAIHRPAADPPPPQASA